MHKTELIRRYRLKDCTKCGNECAEACPVYRFYGTHHPQQLARLFLDGGAEKALDHRLIWYCVNCRACTEACPFDVEFADFIRELRIGRTDYKPVLEGLVFLYQRMQADLPEERGGKTRGKKGLLEKRGGKVRAGTARSPALVPISPQNRLDWVNATLDVNRDSDVVLFTGCLPFFEAAFAQACGIHPIHTAGAAVAILNHLGVSPLVLEDERCCGRDMYDIGERETFRRLAEHNISVLKKRKVEKVITICPECAFTLKHTYRGEFGTPPFEVSHITEFISQHLDELDIIEGEERFTFHDPCYLGRYLGVFDAPRKILEALSGGPPAEMERSREGAPCCGAGSWINHGGHTRAAVNERIVEAHESGAETLVTACPKCSILFREVNPDGAWRQSPVAVKDILTIIAAALNKKGEKQ